MLFQATLVNPASVNVFPKAKGVLVGIIGIDPEHANPECVGFGLVVFHGLVPLSITVRYRALAEIPCRVAFSMLGSSKSFLARNERVASASA